MLERLNEEIEAYKNLCFKESEEDFYVRLNLGILKILYYIRDGSHEGYKAFVKELYADRGWECPYN